MQKGRASKSNVYLYSQLVINDATWWFQSSGASSSSDSNLATLQESNLDDADADTEVDENVNADDDTEGNTCI